MELIFLTGDFKPVCAPIDSCSSLIWSRRYYECGSFSAKFPSYGIPPVLNAKYVYNPDARELARIESISIDESEGAVFSGRAIESILCDRIIYDEGTLSGNLENIVRTAVEDNAVNSRAIERLEIGDLCGITDNVNLEVDYDNLSDWIYDALKPCGASYRIKFDHETGALLFYVIKGLDRSSEQSKNVCAAFSVELDNVASLEYEYSERDMKNVVYARGSDGTIVKAVSSDVPENASGKYREMFVKAEDVKREDFPLEVDYKRNLLLRARAALNDFSKTFSLKGEASQGAAPVYREDYDLGDLCDVYVKGFGVKCKVRIIAVDEVWENGSRRIVTSFGDDTMTVRRYVKREMKYAYRRK